MKNKRTAKRKLNMKTYIAFVINENGNWITIVSDYKTKKDFMSDLKRNGYKRVSKNLIKVFK